MSRAYRYATIGLMWILAITCHWFGTVFFAPGTDVYVLAAPGIGTFIEEGWRATQYKVFVQYIPLTIIGLSLLWGFATEYEDAVNTGVRR